MENLKTSGEVAAELGVSHHRVVYAINTRKLKPTATAGHFRLFSASDIRAIADVLATIEDAGNGRPTRLLPATCEGVACVAGK